MSIFFLKESARRPLPGSMPSVDSVFEARELVATQDENPNLDTDEMPFDHTYEPPTSSIDAILPEGDRPSAEPEPERHPVGV